VGGLVFVLEGVVVCFLFWCFMNALKPDWSMYFLNSSRCWLGVIFVTLKHLVFCCPMLSAPYRVSLGLTNCATVFRHFGQCMW
jgi:hypothetical protein